MINPYTILSTKKLQASVKYKLMQVGIEIKDYAFINKETGDYRLVAEAVKNNPAHFVFTSKMAVDTFISALQYYKMKVPANAIIYCLEGNTKKSVLAARMKPFLTATSASQLAQMIVKKKFSKKVVFFCSDIRRKELPELLTAANIDITEVEVYKTTLNSQNITCIYKAVLFFSPSGVQSFFSRNKISANIPCICIGNTTANEVKKKLPYAKIIVPDKPSLQNMIAKVMQCIAQSERLRTSK